MVLTLPAQASWAELSPQGMGMWRGRGRDGGERWLKSAMSGQTGHGIAVSLSEVGRPAWESSQA